MKLQNLFIFSMLTIGMVAFSGCSKKQSGCTNSAAANYDSSADEDDGSCYFTGNATFWTLQSDAFGAVKVEVGGQTQTISQDLVNPVGPSSCTSCANCANFKLRAGSYTYSASDGQTTRNGTVIITRDSCLIKRIAR